MTSRAPIYYDAAAGTLKSMSAGAGDAVDPALVSGGGGGGGPVQGTVTVPASSSFTWVNQGTATVSDTSNGMVITGPSAGGDSVRILEQAAPSAPFSVYARIEFDFAGSTNQCGISLRNSTSGRIVAINPYTTANTIGLFRWTAPTTFSAAPLTRALWSGQPRWYRADVTSTTITVYWSWDGKVWFQLGTETLSTFLTASGGTLDKAGVFVEPNNGQVIMQVQSFGFTLP